MALLFLVLWVSAAIFLSSAESNSSESENVTKNEATASPHLNMSPFLLSFYNGLTSEKIFDKIFITTFCPEEVAHEFYKNSFYFAQKLGVKHPGPYSGKVAAATSKAFKDITPLQYFKVFGTAMERFFSESGLAKKYDQQQLLQSFVNSLKNALKSVGGSGPKAGIKALAVGSTNMFQRLGKVRPDQITSILETFTKEMKKIHSSSDQL